jgi:hypothetical protein
MRSAHQPDHLRGGEDDQRPGVPASRDAEPGQQPEAQPGDGCEHSGQVDQRRPRPTCSRRSSARPGAETAPECRYTAHRGTRRSRTRRSRVLHVPPGRVANGPDGRDKGSNPPGEHCRGHTQCGYGNDEDPERPVQTEASQRRRRGHRPDHHSDAGAGDGYAHPPPPPAAGGKGTAVASSGTQQRPATRWVCWPRRWRAVGENIGPSQRATASGNRRSAMRSVGSSGGSERAASSRITYMRDARGCRGGRA